MYTDKFELFNEKSDFVFEKANVIKHTGIPDVFADLDALTSACQPHDLILVDTNETAFTMNIAVNTAVKAKKTVAFFSLAMSKQLLVQRILCSESDIDFQNMKNGTLNEEDWTRLVRTADLISRAHLHIDDTPDISVVALSTKARHLKVEHGLNLIIIDNLQLMQASNAKSSANRQNVISEITPSLKALAKELHVPIIALSH